MNLCLGWKGDFCAACLMHKGLKAPWQCVRDSSHEIAVLWMVSLHMFVRAPCRRTNVL